MMGKCTLIPRGLELGAKVSSEDMILWFYPATEKEKIMIRVPCKSRGFLASGSSPVGMGHWSAL